MSAERKGAWPRRLTAMAAAGAMISSCGGEGESAPPGASGAEATGAPAQQLYWVDRQGVVGAAAGPPQALITSPATIGQALRKETGTWIYGLFSD